jgi:uncharacterized protein (DUF169 family)
MSRGENAVTEWERIERRLHQALPLPRRPVAVAFCDRLPAGVAKFIGSEPSGCSFWRLAARGHAFYTVPADHYNCAIGSYTHNLPLPPERSHELTQMLGFMSDIGYLRIEEVSRISRLPRTPAAVVYAPLGETPVEPDVVLLTGRPGTLMLVLEAANQAGATAQIPILGRPTCMALPIAIASGAVMSAGCIGSRVYTDVGEDELYMAIPANDLCRIANEIDAIVAANSKLAEHHSERRRQLASE